MGEQLSFEYSLGTRPKEWEVNYALVCWIVLAELELELQVLVAYFLVHAAVVALPQAFVARVFVADVSVPVGAVDDVASVGQVIRLFPHPYTTNSPRK